MNEPVFSEWQTFMADQQEIVNLLKYDSSFPHQLIQIAPRCEARERLGVLIRAGLLPSR